MVKSTDKHIILVLSNYTSSSCSLIKTHYPCKMHGLFKRDNQTAAKAIFAVYNQIINADIFYNKKKSAGPALS